MLVKDHLQVTKLKINSDNILVKLNFKFKKDEQDICVELEYKPKKFKINEETIYKYLEELMKEHSFLLEDLSVRLIDDFFDVSVPVIMYLKLSTVNNGMEISINAEKKQPRV